MLKTKLAIAAMTIIAIMLALFSAFMPPVGVQKHQEERGVFLEPEEPIASTVEISYKDEERKQDSAHFLGERFYLTFFIQYRNSEVEPDISSIKRADLYPFELVGDVELEHEDVTGNISEYRYTVEVMAIEALPGHEYFINPIEVRYSVLGSGGEGIIDVAPKYAFNIGEYGTSMPRPYMEYLNSNLSLRQTIFAVASMIFLFALILILQHYRETVELQHEDVFRDTSEIERMLKKLYKYTDNTWLKKENADARMKELEKDTKVLAQALYGMSPKQFDMEDHGKELNAIRRIFYKAYTEHGPDYAEVADAAKRSADVFEKTIDILHLSKKGGGR